MIGVFPQAYYLRIWIHVLSAIYGTCINVYLHLSDHTSMKSKRLCFLKSCTLVKNTCGHTFVNQWDFSYGFAIVNFVLNKSLHCFCDRKCVRILYLSRNSLKANLIEIQPIQTDLGKHSFHAISNACTCHTVVICPLFLFLVSPLFELSLYFFSINVLINCN